MKTRMIVLTMLVVLLVLPAAIYAQEKDPEAVVTAFFEAFNAGDLEGTMAYYADDAVMHLVPFHEPYVGKEAIRAAFAEMIAGHATVEYEILKVEGDTVTLTVDDCGTDAWEEAITVSCAPPTSFYYLPIIVKNF